MSNSCLERTLGRFRCSRASQGSASNGAFWDRASEFLELCDGMGSTLIRKCFETFHVTLKDNPSGMSVAVETKWVCSPLGLVIGFYIGNQLEDLPREWDIEI